jgi:hypothetical protein
MHYHRDYKVKALIIGGSGDGEWVAWPMHQGRLMQRVIRPAIHDISNRAPSDRIDHEMTVETEVYRLHEWTAEGHDFWVFTPTGIGAPEAMHRLMHTYSLHAQFRRDDR